MNQNVKILGRRLYSPSLKDVAWLEDNQLIFQIFHTFVCVKKKKSSILEEVICYRIAIQTLKFLAALPTRQDGVENLDKAYKMMLDSFWVAHNVLFLKTSKRKPICSTS